MSAPFGTALKGWRELRRVSQLDLALAARVSQRHVSFLESGRASPSRQMVVHLARALDVPLRERNALLMAAGFAPIYSEHGLDSGDLDQIRHVLEVIVDAQDPFPAYVVDRSWTVVLSNEAARRLTSRLVAPNSVAVAGGVNVARLLFHPDGARPHVANWEEVAVALLARLERELAGRPRDEALKGLYDELSAYPGVPGLSRRPGLPDAADLLVPLQIRARGLDLHLFTTIATIGAPHDITLEELRLEMLLPADPDSEAALGRLAEG